LAVDPALKGALRTFNRVLLRGELLVA
jgi:hypothetical protein